MKFALNLMVGVFISLVSFQVLAVDIPNVSNTCNKTIQGGSDVFPWTIAEPFPWKTIQGVWKVHNNPDILFQFRVTNPNRRSRRLLVQIYSRQNCAEPLYKVPAVISETEKDVANILVDDKLMKLAWFNTANLKMNPNQCGEFVMAASLVASEDSATSSTGLPDSRYDGRVSPNEQGDEFMDTDNFFLKKISNSLEIYCKRKI